MHALVLYAPKCVSANVVLTSTFFLSSLNTIMQLALWMLSEKLGSSYMTSPVQKLGTGLFHHVRHLCMLEPVSFQSRDCFFLNAQELLCVHSCYSAAN